MSEENVKETKEQKFCRLAETRINNALDKIRLIGNLANPQYAYSPVEVEKIITALNNAVVEVEEKFKNVIDRKRKKFTFEVSLHVIDGLDELDPKTHILKEFGVFDNVEFIKIPEFVRFKNPRYNIVIPDTIIESVILLIKHFPERMELGTDLVLCE